MRAIAIFLVCLLWGCSHDAGRNLVAIIPAAEAKQHKDKLCTVEVVVRASKQEKDRRVHYLDSETDYKDPKNFAVVIADETVDRFAKAGIENPAAYFKDKTIRVTGKIVFQGDQYQIVVTEPVQVQIVSKPK